MVDLITILVNLSHSLDPVEKMLSGMGYIFGVGMIVVGLIKLKGVASERRGGGQHGGTGAGLVFLFGGGLMLYLPSTVTAFTNTFFGVANVLSYSGADQAMFYRAMLKLIETAGLIWFIRGLYLIVHSSHESADKKIGPKGFTFLIAGVLAIHIESTIQAITFTADYFFAMMAGIKSNV